MIRIEMMHYATLQYNALYFIQNNVRTGDANCVYVHQKATLVFIARIVSSATIPSHRLCTVHFLLITPQSITRGII